MPQSGGPGFKSHSGHLLELFLGVPVVNSLAIPVNSRLGFLPCYVAFQMFVSGWFVSLSLKSISRGMITKYCIHDVHVSSQSGTNTSQFISMCVACGSSTSSQCISVCFICATSTSQCISLWVVCGTSASILNRDL